MCGESIDTWKLEEDMDKGDGDPVGADDTFAALFLCGHAVTQ